MEPTPLYNLRIAKLSSKADFSKEPDPQAAIRGYSRVLEAAEQLFGDNYLSDDGKIWPGTFGGLPTLEMSLSIDDHLRELESIAQGYQGVVLNLQHGKSMLPCFIMDGTPYLKDFMRSQLLAKHAFQAYRAAEGKGR